MKPPKTPPQFSPLLTDFLGKSDGRKLQKVLNETAMIDHEGRYLHWDQMRHRNPPDDLTSEEWWLGTRMARQAAAQPLPFSDKQDTKFFFTEPPILKHLEHYLDMNAGGALGSNQSSLTVDDSKKYLQKTLAEEPFSSSLIEGAVTTREIAKEMIFKNRSPLNRDERMVLNNYKGMEFVKEIRHEKLTPSYILELHGIMTEGTLDNPDGEGRLRTNQDSVAVVDDSTGEVLHLPPDADLLEHRLQLLCDFANKGNDHISYCHPLVKAITLHFMLAYDHPFIDGNGRTARAIFYWALMKSGYWLMEYTSISSIIAKSPTDYYRSFLYSETDEGDLTYFLIHQAQITQQALERLHNYADEKRREFGRFQEIISSQKNTYPLNERQALVIQDFVMDPDRKTTIDEHMHRFRISYLTARNDLEDMVLRKLIKKSKDGRTSIYKPIPKIGRELLARP